MGSNVEHLSIHDQDSILVAFIKPAKALQWVPMWNTWVFMIKIVVSLWRSLAFLSCVYSALHSRVNFSEHMTVSIDFSLKHMWHSRVEMEEEGEEGLDEGWRRGGRSGKRYGRGEEEEEREEKEDKREEGRLEDEPETLQELCQHQSLATLHTPIWDVYAVINTCSKWYAVTQILLCR